MGDLGSIPGLGRSPGEGEDYPILHSGLENSTDCMTVWSVVSQRVGHDRVTFTHRMLLVTSDRIIHNRLGFCMEGIVSHYAPKKSRAGADLRQRSLQQFNDITMEPVRLCCPALRYQLHPALSPNASGGLTPLSPPSELQEIPVAIREQSGVLCFHSR